MRCLAYFSRGTVTVETANKAEGSTLDFCEVLLLIVLCSGFDLKKKKNHTHSFTVCSSNWPQSPNPPTSVSKVLRLYMCDTCLNLTGKRSSTKKKPWPNMSTYPEGRGESLLKGAAAQCQPTFVYVSTWLVLPWSPMPLLTLLLSLSLPMACTE